MEPSEFQEQRHQNNGRLHAWPQEEPTAQTEYGIQKTEPQDDFDKRSAERVSVPGT